MTPLVTWSGCFKNKRPFLCGQQHYFHYLFPYQNIMYPHFLVLPPDTSCGQSHWYDTAASILTCLAKSDKLSQAVYSKHQILLSPMRLKEMSRPYKVQSVYQCRSRAWMTGWGGKQEERTARKLPSHGGKTRPQKAQVMLCLLGA